MHRCLWTIIWLITSVLDSGVFYRSVAQSMLGNASFLTCYHYQYIVIADLSGRSKLI
jgi:hypothetical protein